MIIFKKNPFGHNLYIKKWIIRIFGFLSHRRFKGFNKLNIEGSNILKELPDTNVLFVSNHQTYFADVVAMFHVFNASLSGRDDSIKNMPRGDLMVVMSVLDSDGYTRKGNDLYTDKTIDCFQAVRGTDFNLKTLDDNIIKVKVPAGTQPNTILQVQGKVMPVHKTIGIRGNLYVKIHVLIPQLSANDLKKIKDL